MGYILVLNEDNTFTSFGYGFCGVGEKAFVTGNYTLEGNNKLRLYFEQVIYKDLDKETRRKPIGTEVVYEYDLLKNKLSAL